MIKHIIYKLFRVFTRPFIGTGWADNEVIGHLYQGLLRLIIPEQVKIVNVNSYKLCLKVGGKHGIGGVAQHILYMGDYEPQTTKVFKAALKPGMNVVDVGANIGYYTCLAASLVKYGSVWAFEPEARNYDDLCGNISLNGFNNVMPVKAAIADSDGEAVLNVSRYDSGVHSLLISRDNKGKKVKVGQLCLDTALENSRVDLIKIDTEGYDCHVLEGMTGLIKNNDGICVITEYWPKVKESQRLWQILNKVGFSYIYLADEWDKRIYQGGEGECVEYARRHGYGINLICMKKPADWISKINGS